VSEESRSAPRLNKRFILRAALFGEEPLRWSYVTIHNLSSTGAYFTFDKDVHVGSLMLFKIDFPDRTIECLGRIRRMGGMREGTFHEVGASFEGIKPNDKIYIDTFIEKNLPH
jgi:hypothetical protein